MEVDDIQTCKFSRVANGSKLDSSKLIHHLYPHDDHSHRHTANKSTTPGNHINGLAPPEMGSALPPPDDGGNSNRFRHWQHSNRIIRVSRASGGKDRHSKVWTAKGPRDRRVRLSVNTAIQFYDLQDRLGFDQPSKAVEWLIKAASDSISELPSLSTPFDAPPASAYDPAPLSGAAGGGGINHSDDEDDDDNDGTQPEPDANNFPPHHQGSLGSKSACSSTSETSKGSGGLSLSRTEIRVKARERARERAAKEKDTTEPPTRVVANNNVNNHMSHGGSSSFTQLLTAGIGVGNVDTTTAVPSTSPSVVAAAIHGNNGRHWPIPTSSAPMDYFSMFAMASSSSSSSSRGGGGAGGGGTANDNNNNNNTSSNNNNGNPHNHCSSGFSGQIQLGNSMSQTMMVSPFTIAAGDHHHSDLHHFPFVPDHLVHQNTAAATGNDYNLNFSISPSSLPGFNRGPLQSNSSPSSMYPHLQRFSALDGTSLPFFIGAAAAAAAVSSAENQQHHQQQQQFPPGLHLYYGEGGRQQSDQKGKGKN